jgi:predicted nucleic acid-binding protein
MTPPSSPAYVVIDASIAIGLCAKEPDKYAKIIAALRHYDSVSSRLYAPHSIAMETLYVLCKKLEAGMLTTVEQATAVGDLQILLTTIETTPNGDASLITRTEALRTGYSCRHSADGFYIALAEELAKSGPTELLTFDTGQRNQAAALAPTITVNLLIP